MPNSSLVIRSLTDSTLPQALTKHSVSSSNSYQYKNVQDFSVISGTCNNFHAQNGEKTFEVLKEQLESEKIYRIHCKSPGDMPFGQSFIAF